MYLCVCTGVTESDVKRVARERYPTPEGLICALGLDGDACCGRCMLEIEEFVELALEEHGCVQAAPVGAASHVPAAHSAPWWPAL
jgi:bacterioferritin-associated ferredoxin